MVPLKSFQVAGYPMQRGAFVGIVQIMSYVKSSQSRFVMSASLLGMHTINGRKICMWSDQFDYDGVHCMGKRVRRIYP